MAVAITAPASQVVGRSSGVRVAWEPEYPQSAFEILYRRKGAEAWNTFGRVASSAGSVDLDVSAFEDFSEYHYRVVCYSDNAAQGSTIYSGSDSSAAYSLVVVPENRLAAVKIQYGDGMVEVPVYPDETVTGGVKVALPSGERGEIPLRDPDDALASGLRVSAGGAVKAALGAVGRFADSGVKAGAYMAVKSRYNYSYTNPTYTYAYRYSSTSAVYYYASKYSYTNPTYYYAYRYTAENPTYYYAYRYSYSTPTYSIHSYSYYSSQRQYHDKKACQQPGRRALLAVGKHGPWLFAAQQPLPLHGQPCFAACGGQSFEFRQTLLHIWQYIKSFHEPFCSLLIPFTWNATPSNTILCFPSRQRPPLPVSANRPTNRAVGSGQPP